MTGIYKIKRDHSERGILAILLALPQGEEGME